MMSCFLTKQVSDFMASAAFQKIQTLRQQILFINSKQFLLKQATLFIK